MFRSLKVLMTAAAGVLLLLTCAGCSLFGEQEHHLSLEDTGSTLEVRTGDRILVTLPRDPRRGRAWRVVTPPHSAVLARIDVRRGKTSRSDDPERTIDAVQFFYRAIGPGYAGIALERKGLADENGVRGPTERFNVLVHAEGERVSPGNIFEDDDDIPDTMTDSKGNVVPKPGHLLDPSARPVRIPKKNGSRTK